MSKCCKWLKKLLGLKKESCCKPKEHAPVQSESVSDSAPTPESEPLKQPSEEISEKPAEEVISQQ